MAASVEQLWQRIMAILREHAPATTQVIRPPVPGDNVRRLQHAVGIDLPADLVAWWALMDGIDNQRDHLAGGLIPDGLIPLGVTDAKAEYASQSSVTDPDCCGPDNVHHNQAGDRGFPFCTALAPFAYDITGGLLCVDLRPGGDHGRIMYWYPEEGFYPSDWATVTDMLMEIAERLEGYAHGHEPPAGQTYLVIGDGSYYESGALIWE